VVSFVDLRRAPPGVARIRERIERGETYQCNFTVRMDGRFAGGPLQLYRDLALGQRGAHNAYLDLGRLAIASASPELFFQRVGDDLLLRPMKAPPPRANLSRPAARAGAALQSQGTRRERDDRRPYPQRRLARVGGGQRQRSCAVPGRTV
jgi:para-aminobenzoate synthetase/4-amino-4-deoxychorismate lyase